VLVLVCVLLIKKMCKFSLRIEEEEDEDGDGDGGWFVQESRVRERK
jgi:hypothetical protein